MNKGDKRVKHSGHLHRKYHRISTFTPDQQVFVNYLMSRGYDITLKTFQQEIQDQLKYSYDYFQKLIEKGQNVRYQNFYSWILEIKKVFKGKSNEFIKLQFMLLIWLFSANSHQISTQNAKALRSFIENNGIVLSQFPELLPYFALPYCPQPSSHPFLQRIYTKEWKQQVKFLFNEFFIAKQAIPENYIINQQIQWYQVVKDLLEICSAFDQQCTIRNKLHNQMLLRVEKYKKVIEDNEGSLALECQSIKAQQLSRLIYFPQNPQINVENSIKDVSIVKEKKHQKINYEVLKKYFAKLNIQKQEDQAELCFIYHALNERILRAQNPQEKIKLIIQYTQNDIFSLKNQSALGSRKHIQEIQCLKLISTMCGERNFLNFLSQNSTFLQTLCKIIENPQNSINLCKNQHNGQNSGDFQRLLECLSIMQKLSFKKETVDNIIKLNIISVLVKKFLTFYENIQINVLTYVLAIILNIILQKQGKKICSTVKCQSITFFQQIVKIWKNFYKAHSKKGQKQEFDEIESQLQSIIYSIFYVLLSFQPNKAIAKSIKFKQMLQKNLKLKDDEYHKKVFDSMIEILENSSKAIQAQSDRQEDVNQIEELDWDCASSQEAKDYIWIGQVLKKIQQNQQKNIDSVLSKFYKKKVIDIQEVKNEKDVEDSLKNVSAPLKLNQIQGDREFKNRNIVNKSQNFLQNYDPNKYKSWKRLKTSKQ